MILMILKILKLDCAIFFLQELAHDNKVIRASVTDPHNQGANSSAEVGEKLV